MDELDQIPSPWRTLAVFARRAVMGVLIAAGVWGAWYGYAAWRLNEMLGQYRARGEFASMEELNDPPGDPKDDAFVWLAKAAAELRRSPAERRHWWENTCIPLPHWTVSQKAVARQLITGDGVVRDFIHRAAVAKTAAVQCMDKSDVDGFQSTVIQNEMGVIEFCFEAALIAHDDGDDAAAIACLCDGQRIAEIDFRLPCQLGYVHGTTFDWEITQAYIEIAPSLLVQSRTDMRGVARSDVNSVIQHLSDPQPLRDNLLRSYRGQRVVIWNCALRFDEGSFAMHPAALLGVVPQCNAIDDRIAAIGSRLRPFPNISATPFASPSTTESNFTALLHAADGPMVTSDEISTLETYYQCVMEREAAAALLALRLYALDHEGRFPAKWEELVPSYLPAVPTDWFNPKGSPLIYDGKRHRFYSVGRNGMDDGGVMTPRMLETHWAEEDAVFSMDPPDAAMTR